jgi:hypothetical protein
MGPQMNANTRKCESLKLFFDLQIAEHARVPMRSCKQININCSRSFALICG